MKKYIAEFFGTFVLSLVVLLSVSGFFSVGTAILASITVAMFVYTMAHVSGTHLNPAVTIGIFSINKIGTKDSVLYIASQFIGAFVAIYVAKYFVQLPSLVVSNNLGTGILEALGAGTLMFSISAVIYGKSEKSTSGIVIGSGLLIGIAIASLGGANGILNPAVAMSLNSFNLAYLLGPIVGAILGAQFYKAVFK